MSALLGLEITWDTINPVQWSGPATRLNVSIILTVLFVAAFMGIIKRKPKPETEATWAGSMAMAVLVFAGMMLGYGVLPHEWLTYADSILEWSDDKFVFRHTTNVPTDFTYRALRDIIATVIYVVVLVTNVAMFAMWQKRPTAAAKAAAEAKAIETGGTRPGGMSRFGRPITKKA
jgi:hypothetical protein